MKFNVGEWMLKPGVKCCNCEQIRQIKISEDKTSVSLFAVSYRENRRVLDGPAFDIEISSPAKDSIRLRLTHFRGAKSNRPTFDITDEHIAFDIAETPDGISLRSGNTELFITKNPASFVFKYDGKVITGVGCKFGSAMLSLLNTEDGAFMRARLSTDVGEKIYGLGERFTSFVKNGQSIDIWNEDGGTSSEISYKNIPFYISNRKYGVFVNDTGPVSFDVCCESTSDVQFSVPGQTLDFTVIAADSEKGVLQGYTGITGRPALPPVWSFGLWLTSSFTTSYDEKTVKGLIDGMKARNIPLSVFHFDCFWMREGEWCGFEWDSDVFPDPEKMLKSMKEDGLHICIWINPYIAQKSSAFDYAAQHGYLLKRTDGSIWQWDLWQPGLAVADFTNPEAVSRYQGELKKLLSMGVDAFKTDFGERIPTDCVWYDGSDPLYMHNYYAYLYNKIVFDTLEQVRGKNDACLFARSASVGSQKMPVHWGGDNNSNYPSMAESLRGGLSLCLSGFSFWSHDIGGFEGTATPDVYKRWCAFGLLSTHSRLHGSDSYRVPWLFDEEAVDVCRFFSRLKNSLMPYIFSLAVEAHLSGIPVMRAMLLEFDDIGTEDCDRQYMLGDALLVAPVMNSDGIGEFYTPKGNWVHLLDSSVINESGWHRKKYDYMSLPLYVRENTILPVGSSSDKPDYDCADRLTLYIYSLMNGKSAERTVYGTDASVLLHVFASNKDGTITVELDRDCPNVDIVVVDTSGKAANKIPANHSKTVIIKG